MSNKYIEQLVLKCTANDSRPAWHWRNVLRWRWQFARVNRLNIEQFMEAAVPAGTAAHWHAKMYATS